MSLKDLFLKHKQYIFKVRVNGNYHLYIEGLDEFGCVINQSFNIKNIKNLCIELIDSQSGEFVDIIDNCGVTLAESVENLTNKALLMIAEVNKE